MTVSLAILLLWLASWRDSGRFASRSRTYTQPLPEKLFAELRQQSLAVEKEVIAVQEKDDIDGFRPQVGIAFVRQDGWQRYLRWQRGPFVLLGGPLFQDDLQSWAGRGFQNRGDQVS